MAWADANYGYKKKITIDHTKVGGDETDFPVLISVTDADLADEANGGQVKSASGYDIVFYNSAEDTLLKHEIQRYTNTNGLIIFWVKVPSLSSSDPSTEIYIYYGKAGVVVDPSSSDTWDSDFKMVHHMNGANAAGCDDSTSNGNDVSSDNGNPTYEQTGKIGYCVTLDGTDDYLIVSDSADFAFGSGDMTISFWIYPDDTNRVMRLMSQGTDSSHEWLFYWHTADDKIVFYQIPEIGDGEDDNKIVISTNTHSWNSQWYLMTVTRNGNTWTLYRDGVSIGSHTPSVAALDDQASPLWIGNDWNGPDFEGKIDELRITNGSYRSSNWMGTSYETQNDPAGFMSWGAEESQDVATGSDVYYHDGTDNIELQRDDTSPVQMWNGTSVIGLKLGATDDANASPIHVWDGATIKAILKMP